MSPDYKREWLEKASIDYFSPFISLWLACNSWYQSHYSEIHSPDRDFINKIKSDDTGRNQLFGKYCELIDKPDKNGMSFRTNIELLHYSLERAELKPDKIDSCSFCRAVIDYSDKDNPVNLIINPRRISDNSIHADDKPKVIELDRICISSDKQQFFAGLFEIIYQVRNMLVHGKLEPDKDKHEVVKYCYLILWDLMK